MEKLLLKLKRLGVRVRLDCGQIRLNLPPGFKDEGVINEVKAHKLELTSYLAKVLTHFEFENAKEHIELIDREEIKMREYPATERQQSEYQYVLNIKNFSNNMIYSEIFSDVNHEIVDKVTSALVARHESLRTTFAYSEGTLKQIIHEPEQFDFLVYKDYSSDCNTEESLRIEYEEFVNSYLDFQTGPLFKVMLVKIGGERYLLAFLIAHIISDATSMEILKDEFAAYYKSFADDRLLTLTPLAFQMKEYALWEHEFFASRAGIRNLEYWKSNFTDVAGDFPYLGNGPFNDLQGKGNNRGAIQDVFLDLATLGKITSRYSNASLFFISCLSFWLCSFFKQSRFILAIPFSCRDIQELHGVVGILMSGIYLKISVHENYTFNELFQTVVGNYSTALSHRRYSRKNVGVNIDPYCLAFYNNVTHIKHDKEFDVTDLRNINDYVSPYYPLRFDISEFKNGWLISCHYRTQILQRELSSSPTEQFARTIDRIIRSPDLKVSGLL